MPQVFHLLMSIWDWCSHHSRLNSKRHRRVVQEDTQLAVRVALVAEGVLHLGRVTGSGAGEVVVAHGNGGVAKELDLVILEDNVSPALATVDSEAAVLCVATFDSFFTHKVR